MKAACKAANEIRYRPYGPFRDAGHGPEARLASIRNLIEKSKYEEAVEEAAVLMKLGLEGLRYLQTYDWLFLRALVTCGYLGWVAFALTAVVDLHVVQSTLVASRSTTSISVFLAILAVMYASFIASKSPPTYYAYALFPVALWEAVYARRHVLVEGRNILMGHTGRAYSVEFVIGALLFVTTVLSLVCVKLYSVTLMYLQILTNGM